MSDAVSFAEIDKQHIELLPERTVMSTFTQDGGAGEGSIDPNLFSVVESCEQMDNATLGNDGTGGMDESPV